MTEHTKEALASYIGNRIRAERVDRMRISRPELADLADVSPDAIANYEQGKQLIRVDILIKIARACGLTVGELLP